MFGDQRQFFIAHLELVLSNIHPNVSNLVKMKTYISAPLHCIFSVEREYKWVYLIGFLINVSICAVDCDQTQRPKWMLLLSLMLY